MIHYKLSVLFLSSIFSTSYSIELGCVAFKRRGHKNLMCFENVTPSMNKEDRDNLLVSGIINGLNVNAGFYNN